VVENFLKLAGGSAALSGGQVCLSAHIHMIEAGNIGDEPTDGYYFRPKLKAQNIDGPSR
jgi:predicted RecA/RadA family phage recombinase